MRYITMAAVRAAPATRFTLSTNNDLPHSRRKRSRYRTRTRMSQYWYFYVLPQLLFVLVGRWFGVSYRKNEISVAVFGL
jgi:hypothetical protein